MSGILVANGVLVKNPYKDLKKWSSCSMYVSFTFYCFVLIQPGYDNYYFLSMLFIPVFPYICLKIGIEYESSTMLLLYVCSQSLYLVLNVAMVLLLCRESKFYMDACRDCNFSRNTDKYCILNNSELVAGGVVDEIEEINLGTVNRLTYEKCNDIATNTAIYYVLYLTMIFMNYMTIKTWRKNHRSVIIATLFAEARNIDVIDIAPDDIFPVQHYEEEDDSAMDEDETVLNEEGV
jgi:hypothetical protein